MLCISIWPVNRGDKSMPSAKIGYLMAGIIALLMIVPAVSVLGNIEGGQTVDDQPVTKTLENSETGEEYYTTEWVVENSDGTTETMWSVEKPTYVEAGSETSFAEANIVSIEVNTETTTVYPLPPWLASILQIIIPLTLIAGAITSFAKVPSAFVRLKNSINSNMSLSRRGAFNFGSLITMVIGVFFATILTVKLVPVLNRYAENLTGLYGFGWLVSFIPALLVIGIFYKVYDEAL